MILIKRHVDALEPNLSTRLKALGSFPQYRRGSFYSAYREEVILYCADKALEVSCTIRDNAFGPDDLLESCRIWDRRSPRCRGHYWLKMPMDTESCTAWLQVSDIFLLLHHAS